MKKKILSLAFCLFIVFALTNTVQATSFTVSEEELDEFVAKLEAKEGESDGTITTIETLTVEEDESNQKQVTETKTLEDVSTSNEDEIKAMFDEEIEYNDEVYEGILKLTDVEVDTNEGSTYETIDTYKISFEGYSSNDLNNISKTVKHNGLTYYLIDVNWEADDTETIDGVKVATSYKGTIEYQTVITKTTETTSSATATYEGTVEKIDKEYVVTVEYSYSQVETEEEVIEEEVQDFPITETIIIISALGILVIILLLLSKNVKVYNVIQGKEKLVALKRVSKTSLSIDLSKVKDTGSNVFILKISNGLYKNSKGKTLSIVNKDKNVVTTTVNDKKISINL